MLKMKLPNVSHFYCPIKVFVWCLLCMTACGRAPTAYRGADNPASELDARYLSFVNFAIEKNKAETVYGSGNEVTRVEDAPAFNPVNEDVLHFECVEGEVDCEYLYVIQSSAAAEPLGFVGFVFRRVHGSKSLKVNYKVIPGVEEQGVMSLGQLKSTWPLWRIKALEEKLAREK